MDATIRCRMVCFENARCASSRPPPCEVQVALSCVACSQPGDHDSEVGQFLQVCIPVTTISCCRLCHSVPNDFSNRVRRHHEQDDFGQHAPGSHQQSFPWWSLLLVVLSMALWSLSITLKVARTVVVLCQALAVSVIADCLWQKVVPVFQLKMNLTHRESLRSVSLSAPSCNLDKASQIVISSPQKWAEATLSIDLPKSSCISANQIDHRTAGFLCDHYLEYSLRISVNDQYCATCIMPQVTCTFPTMPGKLGHVLPLRALDGLGGSTV